MAQIRFTAGEDACTVFGVTFAPGEWLDAATLAPEVVAALSVNPTFDYRPDPPDPTLADPDEIKAALNELGVRYHHRLGLANLRTLLATATAED